MNQADKVNGWTALMQATFYCHRPVISCLISAGADPTITAINGCTALDLATLVDDQESALVRLLANTTIQIIPPSLEMSNRRRLQANRRDQQSVNNLLQCRHLKIFQK